MSGPAAGDPAVEEPAVWAELAAGRPGLRERWLRRLRAAAAPPAERALAASALVLHTLADFSDFRGLAEAWAVFDAEAPAGPHADAVRLGRSMLDHRFDPADPSLDPVRARLRAVLRDDIARPADERLLLAKVLVDHDGMRNDDLAAEHLLARMQDVLADASPRWQVAWWRLAAQTHEYAGRTALAEAAAARFGALLPRLDDPEAHFALACENLRQALHVDDLGRAERAFVAIERLRVDVRPALLPHGLRAQVALQLRRREWAAALERTRLILALCEDHEVPLRDRAGYVEQQAHALAGLGRHADAVALLESLRETQVGGQAAVLEAIVAMARAVQALDEAPADAPARAQEAVRRASAVGLHRFLMSFPEHAARIAALALAAGVETAFVRHAVRERRLPPPHPAPAVWPWALEVRVLGPFTVLRDGGPLGGARGKAQKKPLELLALLAAHPEGLSMDALIDALWPSLDTEAPRAALEMAISRLRKWLALPAAVRVADGRVGLDARTVWSDVRALAEAAAQGDAEAALAAYRGPLLAGERLHGAAAQARERWAAVFAACVQAAVEPLRAAGRDGEARSLVSRARAVDPGRASWQDALRG